MLARLSSRVAQISDLEEDKEGMEEKVIISKRNW